MAQIIASLKSRDGKILIPGIYDDVLPPTPQEIEAWKRLPFDPEEFRKNEVGSPALTGEPGYDVLTRIWARPTLEVHGISGGYTGDGGKTVIPATASAKISLRLVPGQDPEKVAAQISSAVLKASPIGVSTRFQLMYASAPCLINSSNFFVAQAGKALESVFRSPTAYVRCGGSIPIVGLFQKKLNICSVLLGFGLPNDQIHAPNEKLLISNYLQGISTMVQYYEALSAVGLAPFGP